MTNLNAYNSKDYNMQKYILYIVNIIKNNTYSDNL